MDSVLTFSLLFLGFLFGRLVVYLCSEPTLVPGAKLLGNILALGRHGASFLHACRSSYGSVFTVNLGVYMTFLDDEALIHALFSAPDEMISFRPAVQQFTSRVFGLPSKEFFPKHSNILKDLRHLLVPSELLAHSLKLSSRVERLLPAAFPPSASPEAGTLPQAGASPEVGTPQGEVGTPEVELFGAVRMVVFRAAVDVLFGLDLSVIAGGAERLEDTFFEFEEAFELAASPWPHALQPRFTKSRTLLLTWLKELHEREGFKTTTAGMLLEQSGIRSGLAPNMLLAVLWASQANTVPATFWALAFLHLPENQHHLSRVKADLDEEVKKAKDLHQAIYKLSSDRKSLVSRCVGEAIRLRVHSIDLRIASADLKLKKTDGSIFSCPKGRILAVCPWITHHSDSYYKDAWSFDPDRKQLTLGDGSAVVPSLAGLAFGGGAYRCPGRFFAEMEVASILMLIISKVGLSLVEKQAPPPPGPAPWYSIYAPLVDMVFGEQGAKFGLGMFGESQLETWARSGDKEERLPRCNLIRLVGLKVPRDKCPVTVTRREI